jgi:hypothetical protein
VVAGVGLLALLGVGVGFGWFAVHTQPPPAAHEPASFELLTELTAESALGRARAGDIYGALHLLERAEKRSRTPEESRKLAELSQAVDWLRERRGRRRPQALLKSEDGRGRRPGGARYSSLPLKQVTVPSSLLTPSLHQQSTPPQVITS